MSDPLWINAGQNGLVGTATITSADNLFSITGHGLSDGDTVTTTALTGGATDALVDGGVYFVRDATVDSFRVTLTRRGAAVEFASDGGADVHRFAPQLNAAELRRAMSTMLFPGVADRFGAREGVRAGGGDAVTLSGTTWTVQHTNAVVYPGLSTLAGPYVVQFPSDSGDLDPADGTNDRIDALDLQVQDHDEDTSGFRRARPVYVAGEPASSPTEPDLTANAFRMATFLVPAGGSPDPTITYVAPYTVASGGTVPVRDASELPTAGLYHGMLAYDQDLDELFRRGSSSWDAIASAFVHDRSLVVLDSINTSAVSDFTFSGISQDYDHLLVLWVGDDDGSDSFNSLALRFNGDSSTDAYISSRTLFATTSGTFSDELVSGSGSFTVMRVGLVGNVLNSCGIVYIPRYSESAFRKVAFGASMAQRNGGVTTCLAGGEWDGVNDTIDAVRLSSSGQNWANVRATLIGVRDV